MFHCAKKLVPGDLNIADRLALHLLGIDVQWYRHRAVVFRLSQSVERAAFACLGQLKTHFATGVRMQGTRCFDQLLLACHVDQFLRAGLADTVDAHAAFAERTFHPAQALGASAPPVVAQDVAMKGMQYGQSCLCCDNDTEQARLGRVGVEDVGLMQNRKGVRTLRPLRQAQGRQATSTLRQATSTGSVQVRAGGASSYAKATEDTQYRSGQALPSETCTVQERDSNAGLFGRLSCLIG